MLQWQHKHVECKIRSDSWISGVKRSLARGRSELVSCPRRPLIMPPSRRLFRCLQSRYHYYNKYKFKHSHKHIIETPAWWPSCYMQPIGSRSSPWTLPRRSTSSYRYGLTEPPGTCPSLRSATQAPEPHEQSSLRTEQRDKKRKCGSWKEPHKEGKPIARHMPLHHIRT